MNYEIGDLIIPRKGFVFTISAYDGIRPLIRPAPRVYEREGRQDDVVVLMMLGPAHPEQSSIQHYAVLFPSNQSGSQIAVIYKYDLEHYTQLLDSGCGQSSESKA